jgi:hypothetical protein
MEDTDMSLKNRESDGFTLAEMAIVLAAANKKYTEGRVDLYYAL